MATRSASAITRFASRCTEGAPPLIASLLFATTAGAQGLPPWGAPGEAKHDDARSVLVRSRDEPLFTEPTSTARRRGAAAKGARLPFYGNARGAGCKTDWFLVGPTAWICGDRVDASPDVPMERRDVQKISEDGLPASYYFVGSDGSFGYDDLRTAEETKPVSSLA